MTRLFVYGTLMRGEPNADRLAGARFLGRARTARRYTLVDLGRYPALRAGGDTGVAGELYEVHEAALGALDAFEGAGLAYRRGPVALADGRTAEAYLFAAPTKAPVIPTGDWRRR